MIILFTSQEYIEKFSPVGKLVSWDEIEPTAYLVQDNWTQDMLGTNFYVYLQQQYQAQTLTPDEIILVNKIKAAQVHRIAEQCTPFINYQLKNKGLMKQSGDYAESSDLDEVRYIRAELRNRAEFYEQRVLTYLCENSNLYPQYTSNNSDDMKPNQSNNGYDLGGLDII